MIVALSVGGAPQSGEEPHCAAEPPDGGAEGISGEPDDFPHRLNGRSVLGVELFKALYPVVGRSVDARVLCEILYLTLVWFIRPYSVTAQLKADAF